MGTDLAKKEFDFVYRCILSNFNQDELLERLIPDLKILCKQDLRFQTTADGTGCVNRVVQAT